MGFDNHIMPQPAVSSCERNNYPKLSLVLCDKSTFLYTIL